MNDKIFQFIQTAKIPVSLSDIMNFLNHPASERTIRRELKRLISHEKIIKLGDKRGTRYALKQTNESFDTTCFNEASKIALHYIHQPLYKREPIGYQRSFLDNYTPNKTYYLDDLLRKKLWEAGNHDRNHQPACTYIKQIYNRFLIDLSYNSSRLEGNTYSLLDTQRLILQGEGAEGKLSEETIMILNHKEAIRYLVDHSEKLQLIPDEIFTLHYLLADGLVANKYTGKLRNEGVRISSSVYVPIENQHALLGLLNDILIKAQLITNPFEQSLFLLAHIAYLQPFIDVNKRTTRLLANFPLIKHNLVPLSFNEVSKDDYISAMLTLYECQNIAPLIDLYCYSYLRTCKIYHVTMESIVGFDALRVQYRALRREVIREIIVNKRIGHAMDNIIEQRIQAVPHEHRHKCKADILEDLMEIAPHRIVGLGVTQQELNEWLSIRKQQY